MAAAHEMKLHVTTVAFLVCPATLRLIIDKDSVCADQKESAIIADEESDTSSIVLVLNCHEDNSAHK